MVLPLLHPVRGPCAVRGMSSLFLVVTVACLSSSTVPPLRRDRANNDMSEAAHADPAPAASADEPTTEQQVVERFNKLRQEQNVVMSRIADAESERHEYALVRDTLQPLEPERRCHRLVGGVLVERPVAEVLPTIEQSLANYDQLLANLNDALAAKDKQLEAFMAKYNIRTQGGAGPARAVGAAAGPGVEKAKQTGVLA